jgi:hypothetical protein
VCVREAQRESEKPRQRRREHRERKLRETRGTGKWVIINRNVSADATLNTETKRKELATH